VAILLWWFIQCLCDWLIVFMSMTSLSWQSWWLFLFSRFYYAILTLIDIKTSIFRVGSFPSLFFVLSGTFRSYLFLPGAPLLLIHVHAQRGWLVAALAEEPRPGNANRPKRVKSDGWLPGFSKHQTSPTHARRGEDNASGSSIWKGGKVDVRPRRVGWSASGIAGFCRRDELGEGLYRVDDTILGFLVLNYYWDICLNVPG
jgi:hypothetical protein